jgi:hypothetical protein
MLKTFREFVEFKLLEQDDAAGAAPPAVAPPADAGAPPPSCRRSTRCRSTRRGSWCRRTAKDQAYYLQCVPRFKRLSEINNRSCQEAKKEIKSLAEKSHDNIIREWQKYFSFLISTYTITRRAWKG